MQGTPAQERSEASVARLVEVESGADDVFSALEEVVEHPAKKWTAKQIPKDENPSEWIVSERVSGIVDFIESRTGDFGEYRVVEIKTRDGDRVQIAGFGVVLGAWFRVLRLGDGLAIAYHGTKPASVSGHKDFDDFEVVVVRDGRRVSRSEPLGEYDEPEDSDLPLPPYGD